jgi:CRP-like cAMP-binding protein
MLSVTTNVSHIGTLSNRVTPGSCAVGHHAFGASLGIIGAPMLFGRNEEIYGEGENAEYLYKVVSGGVRVYRVLDDGRRQIGAFYLPGDVFGLESGNAHGASAEALCDTKVLVFKHSVVLAHANLDSDVARELWGITARELQCAQGHILLLIKSARERFASFLLEMAARMSNLNEVELPMSRQDIADYLGLTIETVSRTLTRLESSSAIALPSSRHIVLRSRAVLNRLDS